MDYGLIVYKIVDNRIGALGNKRIGALFAESEIFQDVKNDINNVKKYNQTSIFLKKDSGIHESNIPEITNILKEDIEKLNKGKYSDLHKHLLALF